MSSLKFQNAVSADVAPEWKAHGDNGPLAFPKEQPPTEPVAIRMAAGAESLSWTASGTQRTLEQSPLKLATQSAEASRPISGVSGGGFSGYGESTGRDRWEGVQRISEHRAKTALSTESQEALQNLDPKLRACARSHYSADHAALVDFAKRIQQLEIARTPGFVSDKLQRAVEALEGVRTGRTASTTQNRTPGIDATLVMIHFRPSIGGGAVDLRFQIH